ncbi:hypothetical protein LY76DRAFT_463805, partial [Colletotrichum caudatum]
KFELLPVREAVVPSYWRCGEIPPSSETDAANYLHEAVYMEDVVIASIPLLHLTQNGHYNGKCWLTTFPKNLGSQLVREPGVDETPATGWSIRIN